MIERRKWLRTLRKENERQEDLLAPVFDERWGEVDDPEPSGRTSCTPGCSTL
jgi:hypothetical protein